MGAISSRDQAKASTIKTNISPTSGPPRITATPTPYWQEIISNLNKNAFPPGYISSDFDIPREANWHTSGLMTLFDVTQHNSTTDSDLTSVDAGAQANANTNADPMMQTPTPTPSIPTLTPELTPSPTKILEPIARVLQLILYLTIH